MQNLLQLLQGLIQQIGKEGRGKGNASECNDHDRKHTNRNDAGKNVQAGGEQPPAEIPDTGTVIDPPQPGNPQLTLTDTEKQAIEAYTGLSDIHVDDHDNSGTLSVGDVVVSSDPTAMKHDLTAEDIAAIQQGETAPPPFELSLDQINAIANFFNTTPTPDNPGRIQTEFTGKATDNDGDGQLSVGDSVQLKDSSANFELVYDHVLTEGDLQAINDFLAGGGLPVG